MEQFFFYFLCVQIFFIVTFYSFAGVVNKYSKSQVSCSAIFGIYRYSNSYTTIHIQQFIYNNSYTAIHTQQFIYSNSYTTIHIQQFIYSNSYTTIHIQQFVYSNSYTAIRIQQFIYSNSYTAIHTQQLIHNNSHTAILKSKSFLRGFIFLSYCKQLLFKIYSL